MIDLTHLKLDEKILERTQPDNGTLKFRGVTFPDFSLEQNGGLLRF